MEKHATEQRKVPQRKRQKYTGKYIHLFPDLHIYASTEKNLELGQEHDNTSNIMS